MLRLALGVTAMSLLLAVLTPALAEEYTVVIPSGAYNPSFDNQVERPNEFYSPEKLSVKVNDTVTWINSDTDKHTITSGRSSGRIGYIQGDSGEPNGIFDSGLVGSDEKWSYTFAFPGTFAYFCTLHPWMFGVVEVQGEFPDYAQDAEGNKIEFPLMSMTPETPYHVGIAWSPKALKTGEQVTFINDFFDKTGNNKLHLLDYNFVILQNGKEIHRSSGYSQNGADIKYFAFSDPGPATIRFENVGGVQGNNAEFTALVYPGTSVSADAIISTNKQDPTFIIAGMYAAIFGPLGGGMALWIFYWKPWRKKDAKSF